MLHQCRSRQTKDLLVLRAASVNRQKMDFSDSQDSDTFDDIDLGRDSVHNLEEG